MEHSASSTPPALAAGGRGIPERPGPGSDTASAMRMSYDSAEPWRPESSDSARGDCCLACEEDESSLLEAPEALSEHLPQVACGAPPRPPAPALSAGATPPRPAAQLAFIASESRETIRNELSRQDGLRLVPERPDARRFAAVDRPRVVSWMFEVVTSLGLSEETLHCSVGLLDRFVANTETLPPEHVLQLLALACVSIAAKHEEVAQYRPDDWVHLAVDHNNAPIYKRDDLQRMEWLLLETVEWRIRVPSVLTFLRHYQHALANVAGSGEVLPTEPQALAGYKACANFLAELSLMYDVFLTYGYSTVATACLVLAEWTVSGAGAAAAAAGAAAGTSTSSGPASPAAVPAIRTVAALTSVAGLDAGALAPNLAPCVQMLHELYSHTTASASWGEPPSAAELGLLVTVVSRYSPVGH